MFQGGILKSDLFSRYGKVLIFKSGNLMTCLGSLIKIIHAWKVSCCPKVRWDDSLKWEKTSYTIIVTYISKYKNLMSQAFTVVFVMNVVASYWSIYNIMMMQYILNGVVQIKTVPTLSDRRPGSKWIGGRETHSLGSRSTCLCLTRQLFDRA